MEKESRGGKLTCSEGRAARTRRQCCDQSTLSALLHSAIAAYDLKPLQRGGEPCPKVAVMLLVVCGFAERVDEGTCAVRMVVVTEDSALAGKSLRTKAMRASSWPTTTDTMTDTTSAHWSLLSSLVVSATHLSKGSDKKTKGNAVRSNG